MASHRISEYNRDQLSAFQDLAEAMGLLNEEEALGLRQAILPYLEFRREVDHFSQTHFKSCCSKMCFETRLSACCGFESIFTFFADQVITYVESEPEEIDAILKVLSRPNTTKHCVYLGENGCLWKVRPISCAMFFCDQAKESILIEQSEALTTWKALQAKEKDFTWPARPVLFDEIEVLFRKKGLDSPHMYFHHSPGLLRIKKKAGLAV